MYQTAEVPTSVSISFTTVAAIKYKHAPPSSLAEKEAQKK